jgi:hypothetical protein
MKHGFVNHEVLAATAIFTILLALSASLSRYAGWGLMSVFAIAATVFLLIACLLRRLG